MVMEASTRHRVVTLGHERVTGEGEEGGSAVGNRAQEQLVTYRLAILATLSSSVGINAILLLLCSQGRVCTHVPSELTCMCACMCVRVFNLGILCKTHPTLM